MNTRNHRFLFVLLQSDIPYAISCTDHRIISAINSYGGHQQSHQKMLRLSNIIPERHYNLVGGSRFCSKFLTINSTFLFLLWFILQNMRQIKLSCFSCNSIQFMDKNTRSILSYVSVHNVISPLTYLNKSVMHEWTQYTMLALDNMSSHT